MAPFLIVTDLDSTLVGNDDALKEFNDIFEADCKPKGCKLVYATGRSLKLYQKLESEVDLLQPDLLITSVGSEIYTADQQIDSNWANHLSEYWDVEIVWQITSKYKNLILQEESEEGPFKVSFFLDSEYQSILEDLRQELNAQHIRAQIIYSSNRDVDILPERSGKGNALNYVRETLSMPHSRTVACGDSGNDITLFNDESIFGIIVENAMSELIAWYNANKRPNLYHANGNCAAGILEGLYHFQFLR